MVKIKAIPSISTTSTELLSRENKKLKKSNVRSDRYDAIYTELPSWEFYDTFIGSVANQEAIKNQEISTTEDNLKKYLKIIHKHHKTEIQAANNDPLLLLPEYLQKLIALQSRIGRFDSVWDVSRILGIPVDLPYRRKESYHEYEIATALVIATIRQHNQFFNILVEYHDRAMQWVKTNELVYQAREHVNNYFGTVDYTSTQSNISLEGSLSTTSTLKNSKIGPLKQEGSTTSSDAMSAIKPSESKHLLLTAATNDLSLTNELQALSMQDDQSHKELEELASSSITANQPISRPSSPSKADFSNLLSALHTFSGAHDEATLNAQRERVANIENNVLNLCLKMESLHKDLVECLDRCIAAYNGCELFMDRHKTFDELTCRLADGFPATPAYAEQWKKDGVPGIRPVIIDILCGVQTMAEERLTLAEMLTPQGRDWRKKNNIDVNRSRWVLNWHGHNVVMKVLHCLDFLRKCRELCSWYGPAYYFVANPLQLPFPMHRAFTGLALEPWVKDLLETQPHDRKGLAVIERKGEWAFQQYLNDFRRRFQAMSKEWSFNWPELPYIRDEEPNYKVCTAMMVLFIACGDSIDKSFVWERKFINATSSTRGQATYMVGQGNQRTDKPLKIPTMEERKPRVDLVSHFQELINRKRERERQAKAEADAIAAAKAKNMYAFLVEDSEVTEETESTQQQDEVPGEYEDEDYMAILKMNRRHARMFKDAVDNTGGPLAANAAVTEKANINPLSAPAPFDYTKHQKRMSVMNNNSSPDRRRSTMKGINSPLPTSPGSPTDSTKRGSVLMRNNSSMSLGFRSPSIVPGTSSSRLAPIHEGGNGPGLHVPAGMRQSISQPSWVTTNTTQSNIQPNPTISTTLLASTTTATTTSSTEDSRKITSPLLMNHRTSRSPSMLHRPQNRQSIMTERKQSQFTNNNRKNSQAIVSDNVPLVTSTSRPTSAAGLLAARSGSVLGPLTAAKSSRMSTIASPSRKASVQVSNSNNNEKVASNEQEVPTIEAPTNGRARSPSVLGSAKSRSSTKVLDREQLMREGSQSRRVSRLPTMKETTVTVTGGVVNAAGMTKRRPTVHEN